MAKDLFGVEDWWPFDAEYLRSILEYTPETGKFKWLITPTHGQVKKGDAAGNFSGEYRAIMIRQKIYKTSILAWLYMTGEWPRREVDHIDRVKTNDKWRNLRLATRGQQLDNAFWSNNKSGFRGVCWAKDRGKWVAQIQINRRVINLGFYDEIEDAVEARRKANEKYFGESIILEKPQVVEIRMTVKDLFK